MVVIVILGILSAIAVPKFLSMSAKAKAAEVGPAAASWSKLSHTYFTETGSLGNWAAIGYKAPGKAKTGTGQSESSYFLYEDEDYGSVPSLAHWQATAQHLGASCDGQVYKVQFDGAQTTVVQVGCEALTPNFGKIQ